MNKKYVLKKDSAMKLANVINNCMEKKTVEDGEIAEIVHRIPTMSKEEVFLETTWIFCSKVAQ